MMDDWTLAERLLHDLFLGLRDRLLGEYDVGVMLISHGQDFTLKVRTKQNAGDEMRPLYTLIVRERSGALFVLYQPRCQPPAEPEKRRLGCVTPDSGEELLQMVMGYVSDGRRRLIEYRQGR